MQLTKNYKLLSLLLLIFFIAAIGCKKTDELIEEPVVEQAAVVEDTAVVEEKVIIEPDVTAIEQSKTEIEARLEKVLKLIEQKEQALFDRENRVLETEKQLGLRAGELDKKERRLKFHQYLSWIVFILGIIAMVVAIVVFIRNRGQNSGLTQKALEKKKKYLDKMDTQLYQWEANIEELKEKADRAKGDIKQEYHKQIDALNEKKDAARKKLQDLKAANEEVWADLKKIVDKSWTDMKRSIKRVSSKIK